MYIRRLTILQSRFPFRSYLLGIIASVQCHVMYGKYIILYVALSMWRNREGLLSLFCSNYMYTIITNRQPAEQHFFLPVSLLLLFFLAANEPSHLRNIGQSQTPCMSSWIAGPGRRVAGGWALPLWKTWGLVNWDDYYSQLNGKIRFMGPTTN